METEKKDSKGRIEKFVLVMDAIQKVLFPIITIVITIYVLWYIQKPEFFLNKTKTESELAREQAKLFIDLLNEPDLDKLNYGYKVIRLSYDKQNTTFFQHFDTLFNKWIYNKKRDVFMTKYQELIIKRAELIRKFNEDYEGIGDWEIGKSKIAPDISYILHYLDLQIKEIEDSLVVNYNTETKTIKFYKEFHSFYE